MPDETAFAEWVILELMGHRRLAGYLTEQQLGGASFLRIDVPSTPPATQLYSPQAVYAITPTSEDIARAVAQQRAPAPVQRWELPAPEHDLGDDERVSDEDDAYAEGGPF